MIVVGARCVRNGGGWRGCGTTGGGGDGDGGGILVVVVEGRQ